jgi:GNAT superfamily N-acetyltransferase
VSVRPLRADETELLKTLRLRSLAESPDSFANSFADADAKPDSYWQEMTRSVTEPGRHVMFVAEKDAAPVGLAFGLLDKEHAATAQLGGMWVEPAARGLGVGRALGEAVLAWARERGFARVILWVTDGNDAAIALYERMGFARTGDRDRLPSNRDLGTLEMALPLSSTPARSGRSSAERG